MMIIMFPAIEDIGLQATIDDNFDNAKFYTLIRINPKGAVTSITSICNDELDTVVPYAIVSSDTINNPRYKNTSKFIDKTSPNVDKALVRVLQDHLFKSS